MRYFTSVVGTTVLLFALGHYALGGARLVRDALFTHAGAYGKSPAFAQLPNPSLFWENHAQAFGRAAFHAEAYYHWKRNPLNGSYVNVEENGLRRTVKSPRPNAVRVFMFGGSTLWGTGVPDAFTIPSLLQAELGDDYDVFNFGESGFVAAQELNQLIEELSANNVPAIAVFYDGGNDGYAGAYFPGIPREPPQIRTWGTPQPAVIAFLKATNYDKLAGYIRRKLPRQSESWDWRSQSKLREDAQRVVDVYDAHIRQVRALADEYGFQVFFFWQPNLLSMTRRMLAYEQELLDDDISAFLAGSQLEVYRRARERFRTREDQGVYFLGNLFDRVAEPIYVDWLHVGQRGNEIVARAMAEAMRRRARGKTTQ